MGAAMLEGIPESPMFQRCVQDCLQCHAACTTAAARHCLSEGGAHAEAGHMRTMLACAELCRTTAQVMMLGAPIHRDLCGLCAELCETCVRSCESVGDMAACVRACRACVESCRYVSAA